MSELTVHPLLVYLLLHLPRSQLPFLGVAGDVAYIGDSFPIGTLITILQAVPLCAPQPPTHSHIFFFCGSGAEGADTQ